MHLMGQLRSARKKLKRLKTLSHYCQGTGLLLAEICKRLGLPDYGKRQLRTSRSCGLSGRRCVKRRSCVCADKTTPSLGLQALSLRQLLSPPPSMNSPHVSLLQGWLAVHSSSLQSRRHHLVPQRLPKWCIATLLPPLIDHCHLLRQYVAQKDWHSVNGFCSRPSCVL